ncbi:MAG: MarR family transcriptional regulator [Chromatiales bacterium]|nr:MarR family transcriptional regulator [Chromatiales bacterium]
MSDHYSSGQIIESMKKNWPETYDSTHEFVVYLSRIRDLSFAKARETLARLGLSISEFDVLATLRCTTKPHILAPTELQRSLLITSGGLTKLLYQLEASGLVSRSVQEKDKRSKLVHLTSKGKRTIEQAMEAVQKETNKWLGGSLSVGELDQVKTLLGKVAQGLEGRS